ncbi:hypothetical protein EDC01DRAFT_85053 [Geopyxis carbonaria]|nr:hypothetical protein EDC01DRAFT_85053 [Geopyxis carbonaria]
MAHAPSFESDTITAINLSRLLCRLDQKLSSPLVSRDSNPQMASLEQAKMTANLEYARQLLHKLESTPVPPARQETVAGLSGQRQIIRRLNEYIHLASQSEDTSEDKNHEDDEEIEPMEDDDYARLNLPNTKPTMNAAATVAEDSTISNTILNASTSLRHRFPTQHEKTISQKQKELFGSAALDSPEVATENLLDYQRQQQEDITGDLLKMAQMLKESSIEFGKNLEDEKVYLDQAKEGLDKNSLGMKSAGEKIDDLRRRDTVSFYWSIIYMTVIVALAFFILLVGSKGKDKSDSSPGVLWMGLEFFFKSAFDTLAASCILSRKI